MTTLHETLERIQELDPKLAKCSQFAKITGTNSAICIPKHRWWSFNGALTDNRYEFREKMLDWLVGQGNYVKVGFTDLSRFVSIQFASQLYKEFVWKSPNADAVNCESELHALALCVVKVLEARREDK